MKNASPLLLAASLLVACGGAPPSPDAPPAPSGTPSVPSAAPATSAAPAASAAANTPPAPAKLPNPSLDNDDELVHYVNAKQKPVTASLSFSIRDASGTSHGDLIKALEASAHDDLCFKGAILKHEGGNMELVITIDASGKTKMVKSTKDELKDGTIEKCLESSLGKVPWLAPTDKAGAKATLVWSLVET